jgi:predicted DNA-binding transcriptional regulator AlpA
MSLAEVIASVGLSSARIYQLIAEGKFPLPVAKLRVGRIWLAEDVEAWDLARKEPTR